MNTTLQLCYRPYAERSSLPLSRFNLRFNSMLEFMSAWNIQITDRAFNSGTQKWRVTYPNVGELTGFPHFGRVMIVATNGMLAYFYTGNPDELFLAHLAAFNGPITSEHVWEEDWDYERRRRKVKVFRRLDGSYAIIPQDSERAEWVAKGKLYTEAEMDLLEALGFKRIDYHDFYEAWEQLQERQAQPRVEQVRRRAKSKVQRALDML